MMHTNGGTDMKCTIVIDPNREEEVIVYAKEQNELVSAIENLILKNQIEFIGYKDKTASVLDISDVCCFTVENNRIYAHTEGDTYILKLRLYQLESCLPENFIKLNQSCLANIKKIRKFDASISGTLRVIFKNGYVDYVSRRNLKTVKERLGL